MVSFVTGARRVTVVRTVVAAAVAACLLMCGSPAAIAAEGDITFSGRGYGHGRGMSQYGSYGFAVDRGADYGAILNHYYGGTRAAVDAGNPQVTVELLALRGKETVLSGPDLTVNGVPVGRGAVRFRGVASNTFEMLVGDGCGGPWTVWTGAAGGRVGSGTTVGGEVRLCEAGQIRAYRGTMTVLDGGGFQTTVNTLGIDDYLRGVLPREMPASWGSAGGGRGMEALKVQAVAARSYALASRWTSYAKTCDTTSCQVYGGAYTRKDGAAAAWLEDSRTDAAVLITSGEVRRSANGTIPRTEFSSSSGGWTAGGTFPAVEDAGDLTAANPNRAWSVTFSRADVAARLGTGSISGIRITQRNGLGADGGRVQQIVFDTSSGSRTFTGAQVRSALGLKSDWFSVAFVPSARARSFAQALYVDILGRPGDAAGIEGWAQSFSSGADPRSVAAGFAGSGERYARWVAETYSAALHRGADPDGARGWFNYLNSGATLNDLNAGLYGSEESLLALGGGDPRVWVDGVYQALLGRGASSAERASWASTASRAGRPAVVMAISQSAEARDRRLAGYYLALLGRGVDDAGRRSFSPSLAARGDVDAIAAIAASAEYRARAEARFP